MNDSAAHIVFIVAILLILLPGFDSQNARLVKTAVGWSCIETADSLECNDLNKTETVLTRLRIKNRAYESVEITKKNIPLLSDFVFENVNASLLKLEDNKLERISNYSLLTLKLVYVLNLRNNKFSSMNDLIDAASLAGITTLTEIDFEKNMISIVNRQFPAAYFAQLDTLRLGFNLIRIIDEGTLARLPSFRILDLRHNRFNSFRDTSLGSCSALVDLTIENNKIGHITDISNNMSIRVNQLKAENAGIDSIEPYSFVNFVTLTDLDLSSNRLTELKDYTFKNLFLLMNLNLAKNRIEVIQDMALLDLDRLVELNLESNQIKIITSRVFSYLRMIKTMNLAANRIETIEDDAGVNLASLSRLDLSFNKLTRLTSRTLRGMASLYYFNLGFNPIVSIDSNTFVGCKLCCAHRAEITGMFTPGCTSDLVFNLKQMRIGKLNDHAFAGLDDFKFCMDLDRNQIKKISRYSFAGLASLSELKLSNNLISSIESGAFVYFTGLDMLDLTSNLIFSLGESVFAPLSSLRRLFLADNSLRELNASHLSNLSKINTLSLERNEIRKLDNSTFVGLKIIENLNLAENKLEEIRWFYFKLLGSLLSLQVGSNKITAIDANAFALLPRLQTLDASLNPLKDFRENAFKNVTDRLSLRGIELNEVNRNLFYESKYKTLELQNNNLTQIRDHSFLNMCSLSRLYLNKNRISRISLRFYSFNYTRFPFGCDTPRLNYINLEHNELTNLTFLANVYARYLVTLDLSYNRIEKVFSTDLGYLTRLVIIHLENNKIRMIDSNALVTKDLRIVNLRNQDFSTEQFVFDMRNLSQNIVDLYLSNNYLNNMIFRKLRKLETIELSNITIDSIFQIDFETLANVKKLDLSRNRIEFNSSFITLFSKLSKLNILNFSSVGLQSLDSLDLQRTATILSILDVSFNLLERVLCNQTQFLTGLRAFYLKYNRIVFIERNAFVQLTVIGHYRFGE